MLALGLLACGTSGTQRAGPEPEPEPDPGTVGGACLIYLEELRACARVACGTDPDCAEQVELTHPLSACDGYEELSGREAEEHRQLFLCYAEVIAAGDCRTRKSFDAVLDDLAVCVVGA